MDCPSARLLIQAFHDDELSPSEAAYLLAHLEQCPPCAEENRATGELKQLLTERRADCCPDEVRRKVASRIQKCRDERGAGRSHRRSAVVLSLCVGGAGLAGGSWFLGRSGEPAALRADAPVTARVSGDVMCLRCTLAKLYPGISFGTSRHQLVLRTTDGRLFTLLPGRVPGLDTRAPASAGASPIPAPSLCQERRVDLVARLYPSCSVAEPIELSGPPRAVSAVAMK